MSTKDYKLFTDQECWHKEYPGDMTDKTIALEEGITGNITLISEIGIVGSNTRIYRSVSGYQFEIRHVQEG